MPMPAPNLPMRDWPCGRIESSKSLFVPRAILDHPKMPWKSPRLRRQQYLTPSCTRTLGLGRIGLGYYSTARRAESDTLMRVYTATAGLPLKLPNMLEPASFPNHPDWRFRSREI